MAAAPSNAAESRFKVLLMESPSGRQSAVGRGSNRFQVRASARIMSAAFADHDRGALVVAATDRRYEDRRIGHAQAVDAAYAQPFVEHRQRIVGRPPTSAGCPPGVHRCRRGCGCPRRWRRRRAPPDTASCRATGRKAWRAACPSAAARPDQQLQVTLVVQEPGVDARAARGSALASVTLPRLCGRNTSIWRTVAVAQGAACAHGRRPARSRRPSADRVPAPGRRAHEGARFGNRAADHAGALVLPFEGCARELPRCRAADMPKVGVSLRVRQLCTWSMWSCRLRPTPGRSWRTAMPRRCKLGRGADARQHQQLRRAEGAAADDDLAPRAHFESRALPWK